MMFGKNIYMCKFTRVSEKLQYISFILRKDSPSNIFFALDICFLLYSVSFVLVVT